jgi:ketosteroid isomerase-like protein
MTPSAPITSNPGEPPSATTPNKALVRSYYESKGTEYSRLLADDVVLIDWDIGVPVSGAVTRGKAAYLQNRGDREFQSQIVRMTEEGNVVVVEGFARGSKKEGGTWTVHFCDIYEIEDGRVKRVSTHGVDLKESA